MSTAPRQHLLVSVAGPQEPLRLGPDDPVQRAAESVRWHIAHPPAGPAWTGDDADADDAARTRAEEEG